MNKNYKVIEIPNKFSVVINYGKKDGASKGDSFRVYKVGSEVIDPDTDQVLGTLDTIKAELTITTVYDRFSIGKSIENKTVSLLASPMSRFESTSRVANQLNVDEGEITSTQVSEDKTIRIGDLIEIL